MFRQAGLTHSDIPIFGVQDNPTGPRKPFIAETLRRLTVKKGWPEILLYMRDEPPAWFDGTFGEEFVEHIKQYKMSEFVELLGESGFRVIELVRVGEGKHQMLAICQPRPG